MAELFYSIFNLQFKTNPVEIVQTIIQQTNSQYGGIKLRKYKQNKETANQKPHKTIRDGARLNSTSQEIRKPIGKLETIFESKSGVSTERTQLLK